MDQSNSLLLIAAAMLGVVMVTRMASRRAGMDKKLKRLGVEKKKVMLSPSNMIFIALGIILTALGLFFRGNGTQ